MTPFLQDVDCTLYHGDALQVLRGMDAGSVDCVVTSPPYWSLRDYQVDGQLGLEETPDEYVTALVRIFHEIRRVLAPHGTCWVNLGDSYATQPAGNFGVDMPRPADGGSYRENKPAMDWARAGLKQKDLCGIPWRVAFALQADGWWLRSDIVWAKPNPMPESVTDRPTKSHEYVFLLTKRAQYYFDAEAVREKADWARWGDQTTPKHADSDNGAWMKPRSKEELEAKASQGRNVRTVWTIATQPYPEAHFATYPEELVRRCVLAGCPVRVCVGCGAPWVRAMETTESGQEFDERDHSSYSPLSSVPPGSRSGHRTINGTVPSFQSPRRTTTGLSASCACDSAWRPGVVLDPFAGSGTTLYVARNHGRHSVGIELNREYCELASRRLAQQSLLTESALSPTSGAA